MDRGSSSMLIRRQKSGRSGDFNSCNCRNRKFGSKGSSHKPGEMHILKYDITKKTADEVLRYYKKHDKTDSFTEVIDLEKEASTRDMIQYCEDEKETASVTEVIDLEKESENNKVGFFQQVELVSGSEDAGMISQTLVLDSETPVHEKLPKSADIRNDDSAPKVTAKMLFDELRILRSRVECLEKQFQIPSPVEKPDLKDNLFIKAFVPLENEKKETITEAIDLGKEAQNNTVGFFKKVELVSEAEDARRKLDTLVLDSNENDDFVLPMHKKLPGSAEGPKMKLFQERFDVHYPVTKPDQEDNLSVEAFVPLTNEEMKLVSLALSRYNWWKVLVTHEFTHIEITGEILRCLIPGAWLNDEVINVYFDLLKDREAREPNKYLKCHFFNTSFYENIGVAILFLTWQILIKSENGYDYQSVSGRTSRETLGYSLSECDKIFVPIRKQVHWGLAVINKKEQRFQYLDSLGHGDLDVLRILAMYYADELRDKNGVEIDVASWTRETLKDIPLQKNRSDGGMFMIKYADFYSRGLGLYFSQEDMPYFRWRTAKEILRLEAK